MKRDFTYIDDLVDGIVALIGKAPEVGNPVALDAMTDTLSPVGPWRVVNIGGGDPVGLMDFIGAIETRLGRTARKNMLPMQPGDVPATFADLSLMRALTGYQPKVKVEEGVSAFVDWYLDYTKTA